MAEQKSGAQISTKAFIQAVVIIFILMMAAGILTRIVPAGQYVRIEQDGRQVIDPTSFTLTERPNYAIWRWFTAPFEVLGAEGNLTVIAIILFIRKPEQGAQTSIYLASSPEVEGVTGKYFVDCKPVQSNPLSYDRDLSEKLWQVSLELTGKAA